MKGHFLPFFPFPRYLKLRLLKLGQSWNFIIHKIFMRYDCRLNFGLTVLIRTTIIPFVWCNRHSLPPLETMFRSYFMLGISVKGGPGSVVGIATTYRLDGPGIASRWGWGEIFRTCPDRPWCPHNLLYIVYRVFPGGKVRPGRDADPSPPSSAEVKNRVELYLYSP